MYLVQFDNRVLLDLEHAACLAQIAAFAARSRANTVELHEPLPDLSDAVVDGPQGRHVAELAISLHVTPPQSAVVPVPRAATSLTGHLRAPGSDWVYARCYLPLERAGYFIEREIAVLLRELGGAYEDAHFLRYRDPDPHVRLRLRARSPETAAPLLLTVVERGERWVRAGAIERFELGTYDREVERYGGAAAIAFAERVFTADTLVAMETLHEHRTAAEPLAALILDLARTILHLHENLGAAVGWAKDTFGRRPPLAVHEWSAIKAARARLGADGARYADLRARVREHLARVGEPERARVARALLHMHCNRIGVIGAAHEARLAHCAAALLEGELRRSG